MSTICGGAYKSNKNSSSEPGGLSQGHRASLWVEGEDGGLVSADEEGGGQVLGHDVQPAHVERGRDDAAPRHGKGPGKERFMYDLYSLRLYYDGIYEATS